MKKISLIFGNAKYPGNILNNPTNDAIEMEKNLTQLGFKTILNIDSTIKDMHSSLKDFENVLKENEIGLFFFAGHGMQIDGVNYLNAIDTDFTSESYAKHTSLPLNLVIDILEKSPIYTKIIILDACRDNPYERSFRGNVLGLAPIFAPIGTIISYATSPGQLASDGKGLNGAFTEALLKHINTQDIKIEELFKRVRNDLSMITNKKQISWEHTSLMGDFYFNLSIVNDEFNSTYSKEALADKHFDYSSKEDIMEIILGLRSHDWYKQNPVIPKINYLNFVECKKDHLFILGRNIYQAADGNANNAKSFMNALNIFIKEKDPEVIFHILNGMLFEIYFDSEGKLRDEYKFGFGEALYNLISLPEHRNSGIFIYQKLSEYNFLINFNPITLRQIEFVVTFSNNEEDGWFVESLSVDGINCLYESSGKKIYQFESDQYYSYAIDVRNLNDIISKKIGAPKNRLTFQFKNLPAEVTRVVFPYNFRILRHPIH
ncbi:caspase family protein [Leptospira bourretii]|uniref:caspase family protein n=1 Tax=Leptospira bourretii TaxID=2484962 RepID=UPI0010913314|nr:caspase family protein [Leptospira bourretii]TGL19793.1 caspase family protein [Leptospira bourretii]